MVALHSKKTSTNMEVLLMCKFKRFRCMYMCQHLCMCTCMPGARGSQKSVPSPGITATAEYELPGVGTGNPTWVLCKNS